MKYKNIAVIAANNNAKANELKTSLIKKYNFIDITTNHKQIENIDLVIAIGGDGLMLHLLHEYEAKRVPIYGINCGTVGFLMNNFSEEDFLEVLSRAKESTLYPLRANIIDNKNKLLFGYLTSEEVLPKFEELQEQISEFSALYESYIETYNELVDNDQKKNELNESITESFYKIEEIKECIKK